MNKERRGKKGQLYRILVAGHDIAEATRLFQRFRQPDGGMDYPLGDPVFQTAVVAYARPFTRNRPYGSLPDAWSKFPDPSLRKIHEFLVDARDRYIAHGDVREIDIVPPQAPLPDGTPAPDFWAVIKTSWGMTVPFDRTLQLCADLGGRLRLEGDRLLRELYHGRGGVPTTAFRLDPDDDL
jgi:hypothetical protein